jgi:hypothetical protein
MILATTLLLLTQRSWLPTEANEIKVVPMLYRLDKGYPNGFKKIARSRTDRRRLDVAPINKLDICQQ